MWFCKNHKEMQNQSGKDISNKNKNDISTKAPQFEWHAYQDKSRVNKELVEAVVTSALSIPLSKWRREQVSKGNKFCALNERGTKISLIHTGDYLLTANSYNEDDWIIYVDEEFMGRYQGYRGCDGYTGIRFICELVEREICKQEEQARRQDPAIIEARRQHEAEQEAKKSCEQQRVQNIMNKL